MSYQDASVTEVRKIIDEMDPDIYKYTFMYQFLMAADISEVCGKYAPHASDFQEIMIELNNAVYPAAIFFKQKARGQGRIHASVLPLDTEIEPWTREIFDWSKSQGGSPFLNPRLKIVTNKRYAQNKAKEIFSGLKWEKESYFNNKTGQWVDRRFVDFLSDSLKGLRIRNLKEFYGFTAVDLALFSGWNEPTIDLKISKEKEAALKIKMDKTNVELINKIVEKYFEKLLRPINQLKDVKYDYHIRLMEERDILNRRNKAIRICQLLKDTNVLSESVIGDAFFKEHLRTILELFEPCGSENEFIVKILGLASLFEIDLNKLRATKPEYSDLRNIKLVRQWLMDESIPYDADMIDTWFHIVSLRNMEPTHSRIDGAHLKNIVEYFGLRLVRPQNYPLLWDRIIDKYRVSLELWLDLLNTYNQQ